MFLSPILLALFNFWIALIQTDGGDSLLYLCFLISLKIVPYLKYNERTEWTLWLNSCGVGDITCKSTLCFQKKWKDLVSAWEWRKINYAKQSNRETDVAKFVYFVLSTSNTLWWPGAIFKSTERPNYSNCKWPVIIWNKKMQFFRLHFISGLQISLSQWQDTKWLFFPLTFIRDSSGNAVCWLH